MNSTPLVGDGELLKKADGEDSWLMIIVDKGDASRDAFVVRPCIVWVIEFCEDFEWWPVLCFKVGVFRLGVSCLIVGISGDFMAEAK